MGMKIGEINRLADLANLLDLVTQPIIRIRVNPLALNFKKFFAVFTLLFIVDIHEPLSQYKFIEIYHIDIFFNCNVPRTSERTKIVKYLEAMILWKT